MKRIAHHLPHYISLFGILTAGVVAFFLFSYDRQFQGIIAAATATAYVFWGVAHHSIHGDFNISVLLEYILFAALGLVIIFSVILRS